MIVEKGVPRYELTRDDSGSGVLESAGVGKTPVNGGGLSRVRRPTLTKTTTKTTYPDDGGRPPVDDSHTRRLLYAQTSEPKWQDGWVGGSGQVR